MSERKPTGIHAQNKKFRQYGCRWKIDPPGTTPRGQSYWHIYDSTGTEWVYANDLYAVIKRLEKRGGR